jgi:hypothetical protein
MFPFVDATFNLLLTIKIDRLLGIRKTLDFSRVLAFVVWWSIAGSNR